MEASPHPRQTERLAALRSLSILDTAKEADFDDIVELASQICETPISVVNLIDADRQWFKAEIGLGVRETPIETSICAHAILEDEFVEIPDMQNDPRMRDNPLCMGDDGLRFYAGALLTAPNGLPLGTLCVLDRKPRQLTALQRKALKVLGRQVTALLNLRAAMQRQKLLLKEIDHRVKNSLHAVSSIIRREARSAPDEATASFLEQVEHRVGRIGVLHEHLYQLDEDDTVDLASYLDDLRGMMLHAVPDGVQLRLECERVTADGKSAAGLGVIFTEFVINSLKYAFPDNREGVIDIDLRRVDSEYVKLTCVDDGVGVDASSDSGHAKNSFGLRLMRASALQLGGKAELFTPDAGGYGLSVSVPLPEPKS